MTDATPPDQEPIDDTQKIGALSPAMVTGLACFVMLSAFLEQAVDPEQLRHQYGEAGKHLDDITLLRAAKDLDFKAKAVTSSPDRLEKLPLPAIAHRKDGTFFILAKVAEGKALVQDPLVGRPETWDLAKLEGEWDGRLILITTRKSLIGDQRKFDIS